MHYEIYRLYFSQKKVAAFPVLILEKNNVYYFSQQIQTYYKLQERQGMLLIVLLFHLVLDKI